MTAEVKALKEDEFYVVVDEFVDHPVSGVLMLKQPVFRTKFMALNTPAFTDGQNISHVPVKVMVDPDPTNGIYSVKVIDGFSGQKSAIMKFKVKQYDGKILGPFKDQKEALLAKHAARPKTKTERVAKLEADGAKKDDELLILRERLKDLEGGKPPVTPKPNPDEKK